MIPFPTALLAEDPTFMMFCYDLNYIKNKDIAGWQVTYGKS